MYTREGKRVRLQDMVSRGEGTGEDGGTGAQTVERGGVQEKPLLEQVMYLCLLFLLFWTAVCHFEQGALGTGTG